MKETITFLDRLKMIKFILTAGKFTNGEKVKEFENEYLDYLEAKHANTLAELKAGKYTDAQTDVLTQVAKEIAEKY